MDLRRIRACGFDLSISRYDPMATGYEGGFTTSGTLTTSKHLCKTETSRKREKYIRILGKCCTYLSLYDVSYSFFSFLILSSLLPWISRICGTFFVAYQIFRRLSLIRCHNKSCKRRLDHCSRTINFTDTNDIKRLFALRKQNSLYMELLQLFLLIMRVIIFQNRGLVITIGSRCHGVMFCFLLHVREGVPYE